MHSLSFLYKIRICNHYNYIDKKKTYRERYLSIRALNSQQRIQQSNSLPFKLGTDYWPSKIVLIALGVTDRYEF